MLNQTYINHLCGFYDHRRPPQVLPNSVGDLPLHTIVAHEKAHKHLAEHSIFGIWMISLCKHLQNIYKCVNVESYERALDKLCELSIEVHEGYASYIEYKSDLQKYLTLKTFQDRLSGLPIYYHLGFSSAIKIDRIFEDPLYKNYSIDQVEYFKRCVLLDICRFSLNLPLKQNELLDLNTIHLNLSPNKRFNLVMDVLLLDKNKQSLFLQEIKPILDLLLCKLEAQENSSSETYLGPQYTDHCELVISKLFPELPYRHPNEVFTSVNSPEEGEPLEDYLLRADSTELQFPVIMNLRWNIDVSGG